jgi:H+/Cl- antiporter ClcA
VTTLVIAGLIGAVAWYLIRRYLKHEKAEIDESIWNGDGQLSMRRSFLTSVTSEVVIGMGASAGREAAPKLMGGASGSVLARWMKLSPAQRRLLVACGGGAGLAAVYNVPLGGAIFTAEVLCGSFALPTVVPALACSAIATMVAWVYLPSGATYADIPSYHFSGSIMVWSLPAGLVIGLLSVLYVRLIGWVSAHRASGASIFWVMPAAFLVVGVLGIWYPQLFGNGKDMAHEAFLGIGGIGLLFALFALKPFVTALTLGSGAAGGVFTPFLATGAVLGGFLGVSGWCLCAHRRRGNDRCGDAGAIGRIGIGAGVDAQRVLPRDPDDRGGRHRDFCCTTNRRLLDLFGPFAETRAYLEVSLAPRAVKQ